MRQVTRPFARPLSSQPAGGSKVPANEPPLSSLSASDDTPSSADLDLDVSAFSGGDVPTVTSILRSKARPRQQRQFRTHLKAETLSAFHGVTRYSAVTIKDGQVEALRQYYRQHILKTYTDRGFINAQLMIQPHSLRAVSSSTWTDVEAIDRNNALEPYQRVMQGMTHFIVGLPEITIYKLAETYDTTNKQDQRDERDGKHT